MSDLSLNPICAQGDLVEAKKLVANVNNVDDYGTAPIHCAAMFGQLEVVKWLVTECKVDPRLQTKDGCTPLRLAYKLTRWDVAHWLITEGGVDPDLPEGDGSTPISHAGPPGVPEWVLANCKK